MKIPFDNINRDLNQALGSNVVELRKGWGKYPYALHFFDDNPSDKTIAKAQAVVGHYIPTAWDAAAARRTT